MTLTHLVLHDVRNYRSLDFVPAAGLNVVYGANAQGKSNLLEAIAMVATGKSFRTAREREVIAAGTATASLSGEALTQAGTVRLTCTLLLGAGGARKTYAVNGTKVRYAAYLGRLHVVTFVPEDLDVIGGAPARRRALLNAALAQQEPAYYVALAAYTRDLAQKNALLRGAIPSDLELLATYDERLIRNGAALMAARARYIAELAPAARAAYARWSDAQSVLDVVYRPNVVAEGNEPAALTAALTERFAAMRRIEVARGQTLVGPHRDDIEDHAGRAPVGSLRLTRRAAQRGARAQTRGVYGARRARRRSADPPARRRALGTRSAAASHVARDALGIRASVRHHDA